jgi:ABC-2 type transport system ATP-binding protein
MNDDIAIRVDHVSKTFRLPHEKQGSIKNALISVAKGSNRSYEKQQVLKDVSFEIKKGEFFGIVGRNGSGKSTLLKMLAGIYMPTKGRIDVNGKLTPFIELGVGFNPELTGRENVFLNGALLGFNRVEMNEMYDDIVSFAELEKFMDQKLKNYSSGMQVRLAFSIAIRAQSDILILDEVLAVGDAIFQKKCYDYFKTLKKNKQTVVFVSHDTGALQEYCTNGILIENGELVYEGAIDKVVGKYIGILNAKEGEAADKEQEVETSRWGTGDLMVGDVFVGRSTTKSASLFTDKDDLIYVRVDFTAQSDVEKPVYGITITDTAGQIIFQSNTLWRHDSTNNVTKGETVQVAWKLPNTFNTGTFYISPASADSSGSQTLDWLQDAATFKVSKQQKSHGYINMEHTLTVKSTKQ